MMERTAVTDELAKASALITALTDTSTDPEVQAAKDAVQAAVDALAMVTLLPDVDKAQLQGRIDVANGRIGTAELFIAARRTADEAKRVSMQRMAVTGRIDVAARLVVDLTATSTDVEVQAAKDAVQAAVAALAMATALPPTEVSELQGRIEGLNADIRTAEVHIADRRLDDRKDVQRTAVTNALAEANTLIDGLTATSTDDEVAAAKAAVQVAVAALTAAADLEATEVAQLQGQIDTANGRIVSAEKFIAENKAADEAALNEVRTVATAAETAADGFATEAETDAKNAADAAMGRALFQTAPSSYAQAALAKEHAGFARTAADEAKAAAEKAAVATTIGAALLAQGEAETARDLAETHRGHVMGFHADAVAAAAKEVFVIEGGHEVGDTTIMTDAGTTTTVDDKTTVTGLLKDETPMVAVDMVAREAFAPAADVAYVQAVGAGMVDIGKVIDSPDDSARLLLIAAYAGSKTVNVYTVADSPTAVTGTKDGYLTVDDGVDDNGAGVDGADLNNVRLKAVGMFYLATGDNAILEAVDEVDPDSKPVTVFSYVNADDVTVYVVYAGNEIEGGDTTYNYNPVDILAAAAEDPDNEGQVLTGDADHVRVYATIPEATDYKHINFGVWAALGEAATSDGAQTPSALGIGFVQSIGDGMTGADMPNNGGATYKGNWAASVQVADDDGNGDITLRTGNAMLTADFGDDEITVTLEELATLEGDIDGNTFSGTDDATILAGDHGLDMTGKFEGGFNGAFFGSQAAEAGGVFAFATEDNEGGAFAGAFGGDKQPEDN